MNKKITKAKDYTSQYIKNVVIIYDQSNKTFKSTVIKEEPLTPVKLNNQIKEKVLTNSINNNNNIINNNNNIINNNNNISNNNNNLILPIIKKLI